MWKTKKKHGVKKNMKKAPMLSPSEIIAVDSLSELRLHAHAVFPPAFALNLQ